ncbi:MAG TPA: ABC transporter ATP-binding protein [Candidatus Saccharimonadales bacterium]|nr:ABC transporter ATP-binding protein [Candidatus Saccharimonadales bacterium]
MESKDSLRANVLRSLKTYHQVAPMELYCYCLTAAGQVTFVLLQTWFTGRIINDLVHIVSSKTGMTHKIVFDLGVLIGSSIAEQLCWALLTYYERRAYHKWSRRNYFAFLGKTSQLTLGQFENKELRQELNVLWQEGYAWKPINFAQEMLYLFHSGLRMAVTFVILVSLLPLLIPILLLASVPSLLVEKRAADIKWGLWSGHGDDSQTFWALSLLLYNRDNVMEITPQGSRDYLLTKADRMITRFFSSQVRVLRGFLRQILASRLFEGVVVGGINIWLVSRVITTKGAFSIGQYSIYAGIVQQFQNSTGTMYKSVVNLLDLNHFMTIYYHFLDSESPLKQPDKPVRLSHKDPLSIEFKDVTFRYPGAAKPIFTKLNLQIKPGDHLAIVGENGAGKSTLIKLLLRFYDVDEGQVLINGHDIREVDLPSLYYHFGALFQTFNHYPLSLEENVVIGRTDRRAQEGMVTRALHLAGLGGLEDKLEYGAETILDPSFQKGTELSGGQWQKVALARAFYRDADVLILDEPTSAVDAKAEYEIFKKIKETQSDKTTIIVSHRFSTVRQADRIIVLDKGELQEDGTHRQLLKRDGLYKEMFEKQAAGYR